MGAVHRGAGGIQFVLARGQPMLGDPESVLQHVAQRLLHLGFGIERGVGLGGDVLWHAIHHATHFAHAFPGVMQELLQRIGLIEQMPQTAFAPHAAVAHVDRNQCKRTDDDDGDLEVVHRRSFVESAGQSAKAGR